MTEFTDKDLRILIKLIPPEIFPDFSLGFQSLITPYGRFRATNPQSRLYQVSWQAVESEKEYVPTLIGENGAKFYLDTSRVNKVKVGDTVAPSTNVNVLCNVEKVDKGKITLTTVAQGVYVDKPYFNEDVQWLVISTNSLFNTKEIKKQIQDKSNDLIKYIKELQNNGIETSLSLDTKYKSTKPLEFSVDISI